MSAGSLVLAILAFGFAWSMGAHYTGACMGMPYATRSIRLWPALAVMAVFVLIGASFLSCRVLATVGDKLLGIGRLPLDVASVIIAAAFILTTIYNHLKIPTSTIQILVFSFIGAGLALHITIEWITIGRLVVVWIAAPFAALALGFALTRFFDLVTIPNQVVQAVGWLLVLAGCLASLTMGANDVSNATGVFLATRLSGVAIAGAVGGVGLALGVLTWGRPLLERVAFEIVQLDLPMASAAQLIQGLVVLSAVLGFGDFTSMNQALVGAMAGTGFARGVETVRWRTLNSILKGWLWGPASGFILAYLLATALHVCGLA
ncbi:MAG TPA: inorganic phosphate transporter [Candidatus Binataceae bacterium]|nr:inorganic phosphate transporter [Candidatus Binataceae bacterium]